MDTDKKYLYIPYYICHGSCLVHYGCKFHQGICSAVDDRYYLWSIFFCMHHRSFVVYYENKDWKENSVKRSKNPAGGNSVCGILYFL